MSARPPPWLIITQPTPPNTPPPPHYPYNYYLPKPSARSLRRVAPRSPSPHTPSLPHRYLLQPLHPLLRLHPRPLPRPTPPPAILPLPRIHQHHLKLHITTLSPTHSHRLRRCLIPLLRQPTLPRPRRTRPLAIHLPHLPPAHHKLLLTIRSSTNPLLRPYHISPPTHTLPHLHPTRLPHPTSARSARFLSRYLFAFALCAQARLQYFLSLSSNTHHSYCSPHPPTTPSLRSGPPPLPYGRAPQPYPHHPIRFAHSP